MYLWLVNLVLFRNSAGTIDGDNGKQDISLAYAEQVGSEIHIETDCISQIDRKTGKRKIDRRL